MWLASWYLGRSELLSFEIHIAQDFIPLITWRKEAFGNPYL